MRALLFFLFVIYFQVGNTADVCHSSRDNLSDLTAIHKQIADSFWSADIEEIAKAPCKTNQAPSENEMSSYLKGRLSGARKNAQINGIQFKDEDPVLLQLFADLHTPGFFNQSMKPSFKSACTKVLCAVQEIYGKKEGLQLMFLLNKYGFNGSSKVVSNASPWTARELDDILTMFSDYPSSLFPVDYNRQFIHFKKGYARQGGERTVANALIEVFDRWNNLPKEQRQSTLFHEIGHNLGSLGKKDESQEWLNLSAWKGKRVANEETRWTAGNSKARVSRYGETNPSEDFAETVVAYRYAGSRLKKENLAKYEYMRTKVFDGIEYDSASTCTKGTRQQQAILKMKQQAKTIIPSQIPSAQDLAGDRQLMSAVQEACRKDVLDSLGDSLKDANTCVHQKLGVLYFEKLAKQKGLTDFDPAALDASDIQQLQFDERHYQAATTELKKNISTELDQTLKAKISVGSGSCQQESRYIYQAFDKQPQNSPILKQDEYFFYDRRKSLSRWTEGVCKKGGSLPQAIEQALP